MKRTAIIVLILLPLLCAAAFAADVVATGPTATAQPVFALPGGQWNGAPPRLTTRPPEPLWSLRTGFRKGIVDQARDGEVFAAPDGAVLKNGLFAEWTALLAEFHESAVLAEPDDLALLAATKPYLIIPSGGLAGLASSSLFRTGLAEYARAGGTILCFTQPSGGDLAALPVPDGAELEGAGWNDDAGPLFRASAVQDLHPVLAGTKQPVPSIETEGYLRAVPGGGRVLLARPDGHATLVLYPFGRGRVVVAMLMSDRSFGQGLLDGDERSLVRNLVLWAKSDGRAQQIAPGGQFRADLPLRGPEQEASSFVRLVVMGPQNDRPLHDRTVEFALRSGQTGTMPFTFTVPADVPAGFYHVEFMLQGERKRPLSPLAETADGWFVVTPPAASEQRPAGVRQPLQAPAARFSVLPAAVRNGERKRVELDITRTAGPAGPHELTARVAGQERSVTMTRDRQTLSVDVPAGAPAAFALSLGDGRSVARGALPDAPQKAGVSVDRPWYLPGQRIKVIVKGMGLGALTVTGLGAVVREHMSKDRTFEVPVPQSLPEGAYALSWEFETRSGTRSEGEIPVLVLGAHIVCTGATVTRQASGRDAPLSAAFRIRSDRTLSAVLTVQPVGPDGRTRPGQERPVPLVPGDQEVPLTLPFRPDQAGIWSLRYTLTTALPEGPGFAPGPAELASGRVFFDEGNAAVLGMRTDQPVYADAAGEVPLDLLLSGKGEVKVEVFADGKRKRKETIEARGAKAVTLPLSGLAPGPQMIKAVVTAGELASSREVPFLYGSRLPDLVASIKTPELSAPALEVGIGVTNQGRAASGAVQASLYEGDPDKGGTLIKTVPVPPLAPGKQYVFLVKWPLTRKAGQRTLVAVVDEDSRSIESGRSNNRASIALTVPRLLLSLRPERNSYRSDEPVRFQMKLVNYSEDTFTGLAVDLETSDPSGKKGAVETVPVGDLAPGGEKTIDRTLSVDAPQEGIYLLSAVARTDRPVESDSLGISILPTLLLTGSMEGTPAPAASCRPLTFRYQVRNAGNVQPTNGSLKLEVLSEDRKQLRYAQQLPFALGPGSHRIEKPDLPRGSYRVAFRASAVNQQRGLTAEFPLADQPLTVGGPVEVKRPPASFPRVLAWHDRDNATQIERALAEKLLKEAFPPDGALLKVVGRPEEFAAEALSGRYSVYVLLDAEAAPDTAEVLRNGLAKGRGVVLVGSRDGARDLASAMEFRFGDPLPGVATSMNFPADSGFGITGTVPVSGRFLPPRREGARAAAALPDGSPAILVDGRGTGRIAIMPFPLIQSAQSLGATDLYSLLLRSSALAAGPEAGDSGALVPAQLLVTSLSGTQERVRISGLLPPGASLVWSSVPAEQKGGSFAFELTADGEPRKVLYLIKPALQGATPVSIEVFTECEGKLESQGKVE